MSELVLPRQIFQLIEKHGISKSLIISHHYKLEFSYGKKMYIHDCHSCAVNNMKEIEWWVITGIEFTDK